jgi:hypothetical protein
VRRSVECLTAERLDSDVSEETQQELAVPKARRHLGICLNVLSRNKNFDTLKQKTEACLIVTSVRTPRDIRQGNIPNASQKRYKLSQLACWGHVGNRMIPRVHIFSVFMGGSGLIVNETSAVGKNRRCVRTVTRRDIVILFIISYTARFTNDKTNDHFQFNLFRPQTVPHREQCLNNKDELGRNFVVNIRSF